MEKKVQPKEMAVIRSIALARNIQAQSYFWKVLEKTYDLSLSIFFEIGGQVTVQEVDIQANKQTYTVSA